MQIRKSRTKRELLLGELATFFNRAFIFGVPFYNSSFRTIRAFENCYTFTAIYEFRRIPGSSSKLYYLIAQHNLVADPGIA